MHSKMCYYNTHSLIHSNMADNDTFVTSIYFERFGLLGIIVFYVFENSRFRFEPGRV